MKIEQRKTTYKRTRGINKRHRMEGRKKQTNE